MIDSTTTLERPVTTGQSSDASNSPAAATRSTGTVYSREQQEQLLILQAEVELLLIQIQTQVTQTAPAV
jgi:hypothetical protein